MSLQFTRVASGNANCVAEIGSKIAVGLVSGTMRVYSAGDNILEREVNIGKTITQIEHIPRTDLVAVICDKKCTVHDLITRKMIAEVDSRSAKFLSATTTSSHNRVQESILVVGSSYKLRILHFVNSRLTRTVVVDTPDKQKVRSLGNSQQTSAYVILGTRIPVLWLLDISSSHMRPMLALDPSVFSKSSHKFTLTGSANHLLIGSTTGAQLVRLDPLQIVRSWNKVRAEGITTIKTSPLGVEMFLMLLTEENPTSAPPLMLISPMTGSILTKTESLRPFGDKCPFALQNNRDIVRLHLELTIDYIVSLDDSTEAASLAFHLPADLVTEQLREIERKEASRLFNAGDIDEAMRMFLLIEEQEESGFQNHEYVVKIILPFLDEFSQSGSLDRPGQKANMHLPSSQNSVFSAKTAMDMVQYHPLSMLVSYLVYTRRKLRLAHFTGDSASLVDTALFRSYILMNSPLVAPLLRSANRCDPLIVKDILLSKGKWRELVFFLRSRNEIKYHRQALDLLVEHNDSPQSIISYLEKMHFSADQELELVFEFAKPILEADSTLAHRLFFEEHDYDSHRTYVYLAEINEELGESFAKYRVFEFGDKSPLLHNIVAHILARSAELLPQLLEFLKTSQFIIPTELVKEPAMPDAGKAILYERLGEYQSAIDLYLEKLDNLDDAQDLAERFNFATYMYDKLLDLEKTSKIPTDGKGSWLSKFLNKSSRDTDLELSHVLTSILPSTSMSSINEFLTRFVAEDISRDRRSESLEALNRTALTEYSVKLAQLRKQKFIVNASDACCVCHKRLGRAVTGVANDDLVHYACLKLL